MNDTIDVVEVNGVYKPVEEMSVIEKFSNKLTNIKDSITAKISTNKVNIAVTMLATVVALKRNKLI
jgi:hypothetical protein